MHPQLMAVRLGSTVKFTCAYHKSTHWYFEQGQFPSNVHVRYEEYSSELVIENIHLGNAGTYMCEYEDSHIQYAMFDVGQLRIVSDNDQVYELRKEIIEGVNISS